VRELLYDIDLRMALRHESRTRYASVAIGIGAVIVLWLLPGFWSARAQYFALPMLFDQWMLMIALAYGTMKFLDRHPAKRRFPYLRDDLSIG
jgi:hypothetical protein